MDRIEQVLKVTDVMAALQISRTTIYSWFAKGVLPNRLQIGPGRVGILRSEFDEWLATRERLGGETSTEDT